MTCPGCEQVLEDPAYCRLCGAEQRIEPTTGNVIWIRRGRVVAAPQDEKEAYISTARAHGIPEEDWPEKFRSV